MKFLILSCNTGGGHHSTAVALSDYFTQQGHQCVILDCLDFLHPAKAKLISEGHVLLYRRAPRLFGLGYRYEEKHPNKFIISQCESCAEGFYHAADKMDCDAVLCVHVFAGHIVTAAIRKFGFSVPSFFIATDYTCSPGAADSRLDGYFIPHEGLKAEFMSHGVPEDKLMATGIPVRPAFYVKRPREQARRELGLPAEGKLVLLTCGSMGAGPMEKLTQLLDRALSPEDHLVVVCGTNERLKKKLENAKLSPAVRIVGFTKQMDLYMDAADLMLTKAGGLTTTEVLMKRLPVVYINAVPGCETRNLDFMVRHGYGVTARTAKGLTDLTCRLLEDEPRLQAWQKTLARDFPDCAVETIYSHILNQISLS